MGEQWRSRFDSSAAAETRTSNKMVKEEREAFRLHEEAVVIVENYVAVALLA
jgi:hypothetical protein